jgi:hypothetical protein
MAANINPQATAEIVGRAVLLAFALSLAGVLLVAVAGIWIAAGLVLVLAFPVVARRVGAALA